MPFWYRCWSQIGRRGGKQQLSLGVGCETRGRAIHEVMHSIGFLHEQSRLDRDEHVIILSKNIQAGECNDYTRTALLAYCKKIPARFEATGKHLLTRTELTPLVHFAHRHKKKCSILLLQGKNRNLKNISRIREMCPTIFTLLCITATLISAKMRLLQQFSHVPIPICNWGVLMVFQLWMSCGSICCINVHSCKLIVSVTRILLTFITRLAIFRRRFWRNLVLSCRFLKKEDF